MCYCLSLKWIRRDEPDEWSQKWIWLRIRIISFKKYNILESVSIDTCRNLVYFLGLHRENNVCSIVEHIIELSCLVWAFF